MARGNTLEVVTEFSAGSPEWVEVDGLIVSKNHLKPGTAAIKKSLSRTSLTDPQCAIYGEHNSVMSYGCRAPSSYCQSSTLNSTDRSFSTTVAPADSPHHHLIASNSRGGARNGFKGSSASLQFRPRENDYESIPATSQGGCQGDPKNNLGLQSLRISPVKPSRRNSRNAALFHDISVTSAHRAPDPNPSPPSLVNNNLDQFVSQPHQRLSVQSLSHKKQILMDEDSTETIL